MEIPIQRIKSKKIEKEPEIPQELIDEAVEIAKKIKRSDLAIFWLKIKARESEEHFDSWLQFVYESSHQELINMIHELGENGLRELIKEFGR